MPKLGFTNKEMDRADPILLNDDDKVSYPTLYLYGKQAKALDDAGAVGDERTATVKLRVAGKSERKGGSGSLDLEVLELDFTDKKKSAKSSTVDTDKMFPSMGKAK